MNRNNQAGQMKAPGFWYTFLHTIKASFLSRDTILIFAGAIAFYLIFYAWPYGNQQIQHVPSAVLDLDRSAAARRLVTAMDASPAISVVRITQDEGEAMEAFRREEFSVLITIPKDFEKSLTRGENVTVHVLGNGAFPVKARAVQAALGGVVTDKTKLLDDAAIYATGLPGTSVHSHHQAAPGLRVQYMYNEIGGYGNYTVPVVGPVIIQAVMLMAITMALGAARRRRQRRPSESAACCSTGARLSLPSPILPLVRLHAGVRLLVARVRLHAQRRRDAGHRPALLGLGLLLRHGGHDPSGLEPLVEPGRRDDLGPRRIHLGRHLAHDERAERARLRALALHSDLARSARAPCGLAGRGPHRVHPSLLGNPRHSDALLSLDGAPSRVPPRLARGRRTGLQPRRPQALALRQDRPALRLGLLRQQHMQFIDSHSHLNSDAFDEDRDEVIARMKAASMAAAMVIACEDDELPKLEALLAEHPGWLFGAWALHPEFPDKPEPTVERIAEICSRPGFAAVGETGLDFYWCKEPLDWQRARFRRHIEAAKAIGKPLIIHARDSEREALEILRDMHAGDVGFVMHCFCGDTDTALAVVDAGGHVSFTGNLTFKRNEALRETARALPLESLLLETDCPYMAPVPMRGRRCEPQYVEYVAECLAGLFGVDKAHVARQTTANAVRLFRLPIRLEEA
ncbi:MAG: TatD family hydrolase [Sutterella wadsworthensis]